MESRKRPKKKTLWPKVLAALIALAILGTGAGYLVNLGENTVRDNAEAEAAEAPAAMEEAPAEEAAPEEDTSNQKPDSTTEPGQPLALVSYPEPIAYDDYDARSQRWQENQINEDTAYAINAFSYKTASVILKGQDESGCYSPLSLYHALAILASGAKGTTQDQILSLMGMGDLSYMEQELGKLYRVNYADNDVNILKIANSLWLDDTASDGSTVAFNRDWVFSTAANYYAEIYAAEFDDPTVGLSLGAWISEKTGGMLKPELEFDPDTVLAIVNTLWYKTQWMDPFSEENTETGDFIKASGEPVQIDFMRRTDATGSYVRGEDYTKSSLKLDQGKMIIVLPDEGVDVESFLSEDKLWDIFENANYESAEIQWSVPKFETNASYDLMDSLIKLGITNAFDSTLADFTTIAETQDPLYVNQVRQDTHIAVNEDGVEAAAYSLTEMLAESAAPEEDPLVIEMNLNRPFLYLINANDGSTLFIGIVRDPSI